MTRTAQAGLVVLGAVAGIAAATVVVILLIQYGPLAGPDAPVAVNSVQVEFAPCPWDLVLQPGTDLYRACAGSIDSLDVQLTTEGFDARKDDVKDRVAFDDVPAGLLRLQVDGVADGTVDVLSCRSYAQSTETNGIIASLVPEIAYGIDPMTASVVAQSYTVVGWPETRWQAAAADPTSDQLADRPDLFGTVFRCTWFLLPPGSVTDRPGIVRSYTSTATRGEPALHVLGPGAAADTSQSITDPLTTEPIPAFDFRSFGNDLTATTGDSWLDHNLLPAGSWTVTDRSTGRQATVDVAPGQTIRVVSLTAIIPPEPTTPVASPVP